MLESQPDDAATPSVTHLFSIRLHSFTGCQQDGIDCGGGCENSCKPYWPRPAIKIPDKAANGGMVAMGVLFILGAVAGAHFFKKYVYPFAGPYVLEPSHPC